MNTDRKPDRRKSDRKFNAHLLQRPLTERCAYYLGLLYADGYMTKRGFAIDLSTPDVHVLQHMRDDLAPDNPIKVYASVTAGYAANHDRHRLLLEDAELLSALTYLGMSSKSTRLLALPSLSPSEFRHFVRGFFDGDGCISHAGPAKYRRLRVDVRSTALFLSLLLPTLPGKWGVRAHPTSPNAYTTGHGSAMAFCDWIYADATIFMQRKFDKYSAFAQR